MTSSPPKYTCTGVKPIALVRDLSFSLFITVALAVSAQVFIALKTLPFITGISSPFITRVKSCLSLIPISESIEPRLCFTTFVLQHQN